ncbi:dihydrofolate reductase [Acetivibrio straminisolvens]|jgi:dihydrofolate reductase|uniref:dihydrofolate reductase n=1 Tax=Acetivibrio straminisolvens TaxID=253314 RepID=UPI00223F9461|nr:dihydrofolate reductase [Acetivibrio straminisolvens]
MKAIVAVDLNWGIGYKGNLLQRIPEDMKFFKQMTLGKVVVMGRKTFESLPGKEPLKDRVNIILSKSGDFENDKIIVCRSMDELFCELKKYNSDDIFAIGGEEVYTQLLPYCCEAYVTKFSNEYPADRYFPNLDEMEGWKPVSLSEPKEYNDIWYSRLEYVNESPKEY